MPDTPRRMTDTRRPRTPAPTACARRRRVVVVNTGDGKGKSSAAFGVMLRGVARGWKVAVVQFVKSGDWKVGEEKVGRQLGVDWLALGDGFTWDSDDLEHDKALGPGEGGQQAATLIAAGEHQPRHPRRADVPVHLGLDRHRRGRRRDPRPADAGQHLVTGRDAPGELVDIADTVTEMREVKHAYRQGIRAERGIDY